MSKCSGKAIDHEEQTLESLKIEKTKDTPYVQFDADTGMMRLEGESYPENALDFYKPIMDWARRYIAEVEGPLEMHFKLQYFNSSTSKCLLDLFELLDTHALADGAVTVNWYYQEDDEDIEESGRDFEEDLSIKFNMIAYT